MRGIRGNLESLLAGTSESDLKVPSLSLLLPLPLPLFLFLSLSLSLSLKHTHTHTHTPSLPAPPPPCSLSPLSLLSLNLSILSLSLLDGRVLSPPLPLSLSLLSQSLSLSVSLSLLPSSLQLPLSPVPPLTPHHTPPHPPRPTPLSRRLCCGLEAASAVRASVVRELCCELAGGLFSLAGRSTCARLCVCDLHDYIIIIHVHRYIMRTLGQSMRLAYSWVEYIYIYIYIYI